MDALLAVSDYKLCIELYIRVKWPMTIDHFLRQLLIFMVDCNQLNGSLDNTLSINSELIRLSSSNPVLSDLPAKLRSRTQLEPFVGAPMFSSD